MEVDGAIRSAHEWLDLAERAKAGNMHAKAVYCMEMAVEGALKAVLAAVHAEVPKVHDIAAATKTFLAGNKKVPKSFSDELDAFLTTFRMLLKERTVAGYSFDYNQTDDKMKRLSDDLLPKCRYIVAECEKAVRHI